MRTLTTALPPPTVESVATVLRTVTVTVLAVLALSLADLALMPLVGTHGAPGHAAGDTHPAAYADGEAAAQP